MNDLLIFILTIAISLFLLIVLLKIIPSGIKIPRPQRHVRFSDFDQALKEEKLASKFRNSRNSEVLF